MDYLDDAFIEEQVSESINFTELKNKLKSNLEELKIAITDNDKQKIKSVSIKINNLLEGYW